MTSTGYIPPSQVKGEFYGGSKETIEYRFMPYEPDRKGGKYDIVYKYQAPANPNYGHVKGKGYAPTTSFSGADMMVHFVFPGAAPIAIGTLSTVSYSTYRETQQLRTIGRISTRGITRGPRTVAGSMIFTVINQHFINDIMDVLKRDDNYVVYDKIKPDELPSFDVVITFANEYGQSAHMVIYGVHIFEESKVLSIEDIFTESVISFKARDLDHMKGPWVPGMYQHQGQVLRGENEPVAKFSLSDSVAAKDLYTRQMQAVESMRNRALAHDYKTAVQAPAT